jgi:SOS-response transcriptional repressor LexA
MRTISPESIGFRIKKRREDVNLTQEQLGNKIGRSEVTIGSWERNLHQPKGNNLAALASALDCTADYLLTGTTPAPKVRHHNFMNLPVISWNTLTKADKNLGLGDALDWRATALRVQDNAYFVRMKDDSMHNPSGSPCIPKDSLVLIEPSTTNKPNSIVLVRLPDNQGVVIKLLVADGPNRYLQSLNPIYQPIIIDNQSSIIGVARQVIQEL